MIDSITTQRDGHSSVPLTRSEIRAERRRLIEAIRALRRLLTKRHAFEVADQRRLNREAKQRSHAEAVHGKSMQRIAEKQARQERSLTRKMENLGGKRDHRERQALTVLRRESVQRTLSSTRLTASQINGIGHGLIRDLAAQGITTAADFKRVSWGKAPNGKGGEVLHIHRTRGGKIHINGIGEHRGRPLMEWRRSAVARAEALAPRQLPADERHRIAEIIEAERTRLRQELAEAPLAAEASRREAVRLHSEALARLTAAERQAGHRAAERRAEFDALAERLLALQADLSAHVAQYGDAGRRIRAVQSRALRPMASLHAIPSPRRPVDLAKPAAAAAPAPGARAGLGWLLPILYFAFTTVVGVGELGENTAPIWLMIASRLFALAATTELLRLWIPRRRWQTAGRMPSGTGWQSAGVFLALTAAGMFADEKSDVFLLACATSVLAAFLLLVGTGLRTNPELQKGAKTTT
ncbi:hypothetical protein ABZ869_22810 [Streptomyces sp. NPDC046928]|uniref:hypothetical protein n=1 Tax=Streptomyces sp. NPDC046928 TaxID=3155021 RepID=UPI0033CD72CA